MASDLVKEFTEENFNTEVLRNQGIVLVDFWAEWCGPCRRLAPLVEELAEEYAEKITVGKLNVDGAQRIAGQYGILSIPTLAFFIKGQPVERLVGLHPKEIIKQKIDELLAG
ncbi:MAG: thioredoxin [Firmicutes bacterium]|nr:thioredoxin [Bacillota bacterium]